MRKVMADAEVGDDVYGEDPTINRLQEIGADLVASEAALFVSSGTQGNLLGLLTHCQRGDEYIVGQGAHTYRYEGGGAAVFGSIQPQPLDFENDGSLSLKKVEQYIKPDDDHFARTKLLCLENTHDGIALKQSYLETVSDFAHYHNLGLHLDGARVFNAAIKNNVHVSEITRHFESVSFCLSKGLGAPVGSLFCASKAVIKEAKRWRKTLGGGMRQAGIIAAAGVYALQNNIQRLEEDHQNAALLANGLKDIEEIEVEFHERQTNMVFIHLGMKKAKELATFLKEKGIIIIPDTRIRLVTHLDVDSADMQHTIDGFKAFFCGKMS